MKLNFFRKSRKPKEPKRMTRKAYAKKLYKQAKAQYKERQRLGADFDNDSIGQVVNRGFFS